VENYDGVIEVGVKLSIESFVCHNASNDVEKNNLEKHMVKWQWECDIFNKGLKKDDIYYDKNTKHACNIVLFSAHKLLLIL